MYDSIIVGGGIAGLQAAIQLGRYRRKVLVIDRGDGRSSLCRSYHNALGYPDGVSGETLRTVGRKQAESYGVDLLRGSVTEAERTEQGFRIRCEPEASLPTDYEGRTLLLATGVKDRLPDIPGLRPTLGLTVYICPDCDGYEIKGKRTIILGAGNAGAGMALTLTYFSDNLLYINHDREPIGEHLQQKLKDRNIEVIDEPIARVLLEGAEEEGRFAGVELRDGRTIHAQRGFTAFGNNEVRSDLAKQLHIERMENRHIITDPRSKMTSVPGVWAAGDVAVHSEQMTIAMGEGLQAAIWMHKWLLSRERERSQQDHEQAHKREQVGAT